MGFLFLSLLVESFLKRDFYYSRSFFLGNEYGYLYLEEIILDMGEKGLLLGDISFDELM